MSDPGGVAIGRHLVDGRELGYRRAGHGPPVLLLHDAFGDSRQWRPQLVDLSDEFTVVAWDAPGCGGSFDPPATFTLADFADEAAALVRGLGLGSVHAGVSVVETHHAEQSLSGPVARLGHRSLAVMSRQLP